MKRRPQFFLTLMLSLAGVATAQGATPYLMAEGDYVEPFDSIASWTDNFTSPTEATRWGAVAVSASGTIPDGQRVMRASTNFTTTVNAGVQKDFTSGSRIALLATGAVDNTNSVAIDLNLNFAGRAPGALSFDWVSLTNSTGNRASSLRVYTTTNGTTFTELAGAAVLNLFNNIVVSGSIANVQLPATFSNCPTARIRFYEYNGTGGSTGSRAKIGIDNVLVTSAPLNFVVTTTNDSGAGSLRQIIAQSVSGSIISFTNTLSGATILLTSGELLLNKNLSIDASMLTDGLTLNGNNSGRIFQVNSSTTNMLLNLMLTGGNGTGTNASGSGGAIYNQGKLMLTGCTVSGNSAGSGGGGIFSETSPSQLLMTNCTVAGNTAAYGGGFLIRNSSSVSLFHCTVSGNTGTGGSGGVVLESSASLFLQNTIVAANGDDIGGSGGTLTRSGNNIIGSQPTFYTAAAPVGAPNVNGDYVGTSVSPVNPLLSSLGNYGGPTRTMPPLLGSLAIDAATNSTTTTDQRGYFRPNGVRSDIGAAEYYLLVNDSFANRQLITGTSNSVTGSNVGATHESPPSDWYWRDAGDVWWTWTAPTNGTVIVDTMGSSLDTILRVYTGNATANLTGIATDDQSGGNNTSLVQFEAVAGTNYQIAVDGYDRATGNIVLNLKVVFLPPQFTAPPQSQLAVAGDSVELFAQAGGTAPFSFQWRRSNTNLPGATGTNLVFNAVQVSNAGTYAIVVTNRFGMTTSSNAIVTVYPNSPPANDAFDNRIVLSGRTNLVSGHNVTATSEASEPAHAGDPGGRSVWWSWTAPASGAVSMDTLGSLFDTTLAVYTGSSLAGLVPVISDNNSGSNSTSRVIFTASSNTVYQIAVDGVYQQNNPPGYYGAARGPVLLNTRQPVSIAPQITTQPVSQSVLSGSPVLLSVSALGTPASLSYQWQLNGTTLVGKTSSTLTLANATLAQAGAYRVVITNTAGAVTSLVATVSIANPSAINFKGNWPGYKTGDAHDVQVSGSYAYIATSAGLIILDVSDPMNPRRVGGYDTDSPAIRIGVTNGYAWLLTSSNEVTGAKISRIDVRNPAFPQKKMERSASNPTDIVLAGSYAYVADGTVVQIVATNGTLAGTLTSGGNTAEALVTGGSFLYVSWSSGTIQVYNLSNPTNPTSVSSVAGGVGPRADHNMVVSGNKLFVITGSLGYTVAFAAIDISNPLNPITITNTYFGNLGYAVYASLAVKGDTAYIITGDYTGNYLGVVDVSQPSLNLPVVGTFPFSKGYGYRLAVTGNYAYLATLSGGLIIVDVTSSMALTQTGQFYTAVNATEVLLQGNVAFVRDPNIGFHAVDISNPTDPALLGTYQSTNTTDAFTIAGRYAYLGLAAPAPATDTSMEIVDISDAHRPTLVGQTKLPVPPPQSDYPARVTSIVVQNGFAYVAVNSPPVGAGVDVVNVGTPSAPTVIDRRYYPGFPSPTKLAVLGSNLFAGSGDFYFGQQLGVWNITNPFNITQTGLVGVPLPNGTISVSVANGFCYFHATDGTRIIDVSQPSTPVMLFTNPAIRTSTAIQTNRAFGVSSAGGVSLFDLSSPTNFVETGNFPGLSGGVALEGQFGFVVATDSGLTVLDLGANLATPPTSLSTPENRRVLSGATTNFFVAATGTVPLSYQWRFNGTNLPGATQPLLSLTNIQFANAGQYSLLVSNAAGVAVSSNGELTVDYAPVVQMISPFDNEAFWPSSNIMLTALATDPDATNVWNGRVTQVQFFNGSTSLGIKANPPPYSNSVFSLTWSNVSAGNYSLKAVATDNEGATNASASVSILVTNQQAFQLSAANYPVLETNGVVTVTVKRNYTNSFGAVLLLTENATAFAAPPGGIGSYLAVTTNLNFLPGVAYMNVSIPIINDLVNRGNRQFVVRLTVATPGWQLFEPTNAYVTIIDDDPLTNNFADVALPRSGAVGALRVSLQPTNALGQWRFWWETDWRDSGSTVSNLAVGDYTLEYMARNGFIAPDSTSITISNAGAFFSYTNYYTNLVSLVPTGGLAVAILPVEVASAGSLTNRGQWRLAGGSPNWNDGGFLLTNLLEGAHLVEFKPIPGHETPPRQVMYVTTNLDLTYQATYEALSALVANGPVPLDSYDTITNDAIQPGTPYRFAGQIVSDVGFSSGFVVKPRTVLTAAHAVFDISRLTFSTNVWWLFQRHRGDHESLAQQPRGWHVFSGYAAARTNNPNQSLSSFEARSLDAAALYFFEDAGRGGYGGYLITSTNGQWLDSSLLKLMVGYPVEGVAEANRGKMHQVGPFFAAFQKLTNQVYRSDQVQSYGGNSGGPVCVLSTNSSNRAFFIPAGIYLGGSGETVVRAIDLDVVDLINRAENSSSGGTNSTGGGVVVWTTSGGTGFNPGLFRVSFAPGSLVAQGAGWRVKDGANTNWISNDDLYYPTTPGAFIIEFRPMTGYGTPANLTVNLTANQTTVLNVTYVALPVLGIAPAGGLSASGYVGGPFTPPSITYTLSNSGGQNMSWSASKTAAWLSLSPAGGTLLPGASTNIVLTVNASANVLANGLYADTVLLTNASSSLGNTNRPITLTITTQLPIVLYGPQPLASGGLRLTLSGTSGKIYTIQTSSNLVDWLDGMYVTNMTGTNIFTNPPAAGAQKEFFRARQLP